MVGCLSNMKILLIGTMYPPDIQGGAEVVLGTLARGLVENGHDVMVLCLTPDKDFTHEVLDGVAVVRHKIANNYWPFEKVRPPAYRRILWHIKDSYNQESLDVVASAIRDFAPDIVNTHNLAGWSVAVWSAVKKAKTPLVHVLHDFYLACPNSNMFKNMRICDTQCLSCRVLRYRHKQDSNKVDAVIGVSRFILEKHRDLGYFAQAGLHTYIHNARDMSQVISPHARPGNDKLRFGFLGALTPSKGIELLLETYSQLMPANTELVIAGRGDDKYVESLVARYSSEQIRFIGYVAPKRFYGEVDVLIVPSLSHEALGMVVPEAYANGIPVIASRRGGIPEIVEHGVNGYLFDPDNPSELESVMMQFVQRRAMVDDMREAAMLSAKPFHQVKLWIQQYESVYSAVLEQVRSNMESLV